MFRSRLALLPVLLLGIFTVAAPVAAQNAPTWNASATRMSRAELQELLANYETASGSSAYGARVAETAEREARLIRERLELGDFRVGDRIQLSVQGETGIPDQVTVEPGPAITLPVFGTIPLAGVLRSELEGHLTEHIGRFVRNPVVTAESTVRLGVMGSVGGAGFYHVPADALLDETIMLAGGLSPGADISTTHVLRAGNVVIDEAAITQALAEGRTIDQLNLIAGDQIQIDSEDTGGISILQTILLSSIPVLITILVGS